MEEETKDTNLPVPEEDRMRQMRFMMDKILFKEDTDENK